MYHATVTASAHHAQMPQMPDASEQKRVGVLVLRAWLEGTANDPRLRVHLFGREDVTRDAEDAASALTIEDALAYIRQWLVRFCAAARRTSDR